MDRAALDAAYDNANTVKESAAIMAAFRARSDAFRAAHPQSLDIRYGEAERNRIDVFPAGKERPLLVFIHGGYWQRRSKDDFSFLAAGPMANGIGVALVGYTLAPEKRLDGIVAEIFSALDFLKRNNNARLIVAGWSAGGHLTAMALSHPAVSAGLAISGIYDLEPMRLSYINDKLKLDEAEQKRNSPMLLQQASKPLIVAWGGAELPELQRQSSEYGALRAHQGLPGRAEPLAGHDHFSILETLADPRGALAGMVSELALLPK